MADFTTGMGANSYLLLSMQQAGQSIPGNYSVVNWQLYLVSGSASSWANGIGWSINIAGDQRSGTFNLTTGTGAKIIASGTTNVGHAANGTGSVTGSGWIAATGTVIGGPASVGGTMGLDRIPRPPSAPLGLEYMVSGRQVALAFRSPADDGGAGIQSYTAQYSLNGAGWTGGITQGGSPILFTGLQPGSYQFRVFANNSAGAGAAATTAVVQVRAGGRVRVGGVWRDGIPKVRVGGVWRDATVKVRVGGVWRDAL